MIRIVTDSGADISREEAKVLGIQVVSLPIRFADRTYTQETDTDFQTFYAELKSARKLPQTSQPSPEDFAAAYRAAQPGDEVLVIALSSGLSGTCQSAQLAVKMVDVPVVVVDSLSAILGQRILVERAVTMRDRGASVDEIVREITALRQRIVIWGMLDTLTYLHKGGRLPRTVAIAGNLLGIKPIVTLNEKGKIVMAGKGRNYQSFVNRFIEGPPFDSEFPVYFGYTAIDTVCHKVEAQICQKYDIAHTGVLPVGSVIGTHVGPGCIAVAFVRAR